ncbi:glycine betaine/L-proline ABC transporter substrate-binding protein ProX [Mesorhizobium sp.]|uniref:glycine betaine/L-proline ABC transporter substrate-binding protein ProX n=1 Tax=Mesorhizobium sp. TaxID=1871066 RepID=UPI0025FDB4DB|nr:glycine betaine/L-proline ABC transporter substrate-binding protein ProX [Mesorhizobium sp.]
MKVFYKALFGMLALGATSVGPVMAQDLPGKGKTVVPAQEANNPPELFQGYVVELGLKDLGYTIGDPITSSIQAAQISVANGDATFYAAYWDPLQTALLEKAGMDKVEIIGNLIPNSIQGYMIDKKTAEAEHIKTIEQFRDPKIAKLFDTEGSGKATLYGCDPGWGCERVIEHHLDAYGLRDTVEHKQGSYFAIIADAVKRIQSGKPTLYYTYTPLWLSAILVPNKDVVWLTVEKTELPDAEKGKATTVEGIGNLGFTVNTQRIVANKAFLEQNPAARKFMELITMSVDDVNAENLKMHRGEDSDQDVRRHAEDWKAAHKAQWDEWIKESIAAK